MVKQLVAYNPYDLVPLLINGQAITGRPFEFDSEVTNQKKMTNAFGAFVKPTKVATVCPHCAQGLLIDVKMGEPPFTPFVTLCQYCHPTPPPLPDPFINPVKSGRVSHTDLDPLLRELKPLAASEGSVADRFKLDVVPEIPPEPTLLPKPPKPPRPARGGKDDKRKAKKKPPLDPKLAQAVSEAREMAPPPVEPSPISDFDLTRSTGRPMPVERADGLGEEQDFDDRDLLEDK